MGFECGNPLKDTLVHSLAATVAIAPVTEANCDNDDD